MTFDEVIALLARASDPRITHCLSSLSSYLSSQRAGSYVPALTRESLLDYIGFWLPRYVRPTLAGDGHHSEPNPDEVMETLNRLVTVLANHEAMFDKQECLATIGELRVTLPRAIELTRALTEDVTKRGGPFGFPEFLTTFEGGGRSEYDLDVAGVENVVEGHFRVTSVDALRVAAVELVSERPVEPILIPERAAPFVEQGQIATLELVRGSDGWVITDCEVVYPPGTRVV
jgi:hypothetical protein